jgi:hypothetical protein
MAENFQVLLFGDETSDFCEPLLKLLDRKKGIIFLHFIEKLTGVLRDEIHQQARHVQEQIPPFTDVFDLVTRYRDSGSWNQILKTTITCICQLGSVMRCVIFILYIGRHKLIVCLAFSMITHPNRSYPRTLSLLDCALAY